MRCPEFVVVVKSIKIVVESNRFYNGFAKKLKNHLKFNKC